MNNDHRCVALCKTDVTVRWKVTHLLLLLLGIMLIVVIIMTKIVIIVMEVVVTWVGVEDQHRMTSPVTPSLTNIPAAAMMTRAINVVMTIIKIQYFHHTKRTLKVTGPPMASPSRSTVVNVFLRVLLYKHTVKTAPWRCFLTQCVSLPRCRATLWCVAHARSCFHDLVPR